MIRGYKNLTPANQEFNNRDDLNDALNKKKREVLSVCVNERASQTERALFTVCVCVCQAEMIK